ncbi:MAG: SCP2 sterol-binding domain-containing protein [Halobacteria archaeon]|nr:SCP2 sterol-binding domain-containing protein [Halobacteria archaeon]
MSLREKIEQSYEMSEEELKNELPSLLDELEGNAGEIVEEHSDLLPDLMERLEEVDTAEFANEDPDTADRFQDFLWELTEAVVEHDEELQDNIDTDTSVRFEATDSPMEGHLEVSQEDRTLEGGAGEPDGDYDLHIEGPSNVLSGMLTGTTDPIQGFMAGEFEMDGPVDEGMQLASVMKPVNQKMTGDGAAED